MPMLEEWKGDAGVQVLEGWSFQVRLDLKGVG